MYEKEEKTKNSPKNAQMTLEYLNWPKNENFNRIFFQKILKIRKKFTSTNQLTKMTLQAKIDLKNENFDYNKFSQKCLKMRKKIKSPP